MKKYIYKVYFESLNSMKGVLIGNPNPPGYLNFTPETGIVGGYLLDICSGGGQDGNSRVVIRSNTDNTRSDSNSYILFQQNAGLDRRQAKIGLSNGGDTIHLHHYSQLDSASILLQLGNTIILKAKSTGVNLYGFSTAVDFLVTGTCTCNSDDRLKYNETPIIDATTTIKKLNPVSYRKSI